MKQQFTSYESSIIGSWEVNSMSSLLSLLNPGWQNSHLGSIAQQTTIGRRELEEACMHFHRVFISLLLKDQKQVTGSQVTLKEEENFNVIVFMEGESYTFCEEPS